MHRSEHAVADGPERFEDRAVEDVRSDGTHFLLSPGHELPEVERVVKRPQRRSVVVEKFNAVVARTVRRLNPRAETV